MAVLPYGEAEPASGYSFYRYIDTDAFLTLEKTDYVAPEGFDEVFRMESEPLHAICVATLGDDTYTARWWPLDNVEPEWVELYGLEMTSGSVVQRVFPGLGQWTFGVPKQI